MNKKLELIKAEALREIESSKDENSLNKIYKKHFKELSSIFSQMGTLSPEEKKVIGVKANEIKQAITISFETKKKNFTKKDKTNSEFFDITIPGKKTKVGHLHPITQAINEAENIFRGMGFSIVEGPELEDEWHNFDALNFPEDHPAREMQDTFFVKNEPKKRLLMRTHTSPVQIRYMLDNKPPYRIIVPGRVFRNEATDASHEVNFHQIEGLMVDKEISVANFKAVIEEFCREFFNRDVKIRLRPSFFPFTEPSFEVDMSCSECKGKGCSLCSQTGWLEILGAGIVHPSVFKNSGVDPKKWQGFAFGLGWDRWVMLKYKINDIRLFYNGDLRFLNQF